MRADSVTGENESPILRSSLDEGRNFVYNVMSEMRRRKLHASKKPFVVS